MIDGAMIFNQQKKFDEALKALDEARAFALDSEMAAGMDATKARIEESKKAAADAR